MKTLRLLLAFTLTGCMTQPARQWEEPTVPFDEAALKAALEPGTATIKGQAFTKTVGGEVRYGAGVPVYLIPMTPYAEACENIHAYANSGCGPKLAAYRRETTGDGEGRFEFTDLKPGTYYIEATITWGVPTQLGIQSTGGTFKTTVTVQTAGQTVTALIH